MLINAEIQAREQLVLALKGAAMLRVRGHRLLLAEGLLWLRDLARIQSARVIDAPRFWCRSERLFGGRAVARPAAEMAWEQASPSASPRISRGRGDTLILQRLGGGQRVVLRPCFPVHPLPEYSALWTAAEAVRADPGNPAHGDPEAALIRAIRRHDPNNLVLPTMTRDQEPNRRPPRPNHPAFRLWTTQWSDDQHTQPQPPPVVVDLPGPGAAYH